MASSNIPVICYCNGELIDEDKNASYIGGHTKVGVIPTSTGFVELRKWIHELLKSPSYETGFEIKCRYRVDDHTVIAIDVDDDQSLQFVLERSHHCNAIIAYIVTSSATKMDTAPLSLRTSSFVVDINEPILGAMDEGKKDFAEPIQEGKSVRREERPRINESKSNKQRAWKENKFMAHVGGPSSRVPTKTRRRVGRPGGNRKKSSFSRSTTPAPRTCKRCGRCGHNVRTCMVKKANNNNNNNNVRTCTEKKANNNNIGGYRNIGQEQFVTKMETF